MNPPNLFHFATSELSQDAVLAYFIAWADPAYQHTNEGMHKFGIHLLQCFLSKWSYGHLKLNSVEVKRQEGNIDLLILIKAKGKGIALLLEDKTFTKAANPFDRYLKFVEHKYPNYEPLGILLTLGNQIRKSEHQQFRLFKREDLLEAFESSPIHPDDNTVFLEYFDHVLGHHKAYGAFAKGVSVLDWEWRAWEGFFEYLILKHSRLKFHDYGYVNNDSGGLRACWCEEEERAYFNGYRVYLQLEFSKKKVPSGSTKDYQCLLVFKMGAVPQDERSAKLSAVFFNAIQNHAIGTYRKTLHPGFQMKKHNEEEILKRPLRFSSGEYVTCAIVQQDDWFVDPNDCEAAINKLHEFHQFFLSIDGVKTPSES